MEVSNRKLKIGLPGEPAIPLLAIHLKKPKTLMQRETHTSVFIEAFIIAKMRKQSRCPSIVEWIKKMWYNTHTLHITCNGILPSHKKNKILPFAVTWMDLEDIIPEV